MPFHTDTEGAEADIIPRCSAVSWLPIIEVATVGLAEGEQSLSIRDYLAHRSLIFSSHTCGSHERSVPK